MIVTNTSSAHSTDTDASGDSDTDTDDEPTPLARGLRASEDSPFDDVRACPHDCHGTLELTEDEDNVVCSFCRCRPDGTYLPPEEDDPLPRVVPSRGADSTARRGTDFVRLYPHPSRPSNGSPRGWLTDGDGPTAEGSPDRERYRNSERVILVGGYERAYPIEKTSVDDGRILRGELISL
jgi:hypothetical protein